MNNLFSIIFMKLNNGKRLYLKASHTNKCEWTYDKEKAIWFNTDKEAMDFCKHYFKNFKEYELETISYNI